MSRNSSSNKKTRSPLDDLIFEEEPIVKSSHKKLSNGKEVMYEDDNERDEITTDRKGDVINDKHLTKTITSKSGKVIRSEDEEDIVVRNSKGKIISSYQEKSMRAPELEKSLNRISSIKESPTNASSRVWNDTPKGEKKSKSIGRRSRMHHLDEKIMKHMEHLFRFAHKNGLTVHNVVRLDDNTNCNFENNDGTSCCKAPEKGKTLCKIHSSKKDVPNCIYLVELGTQSGVTFFVTDRITDKHCFEPNVDEYMSYVVEDEDFDEILKISLAYDSLGLPADIICVKDTFGILQLTNSGTFSAYRHVGKEVKRLKERETYHLCIPLQYFKTEMNTYKKGDELIETLNEIVTLNKELLGVFISNRSDSLSEIDYDVLKLKTVLEDSLKSKREIAEQLYSSYCDTVKILSESSLDERERAEETSRSMKHVVHEFSSRLKHSISRYEIIKHLIEEEEEETKELMKKYSSYNVSELLSEKERTLPIESEIFVDLANMDPFEESENSKEEFSFPTEDLLDTDILGENEQVNMEGEEGEVDFGDISMIPNVLDESEVAFEDLIDSGDEY